MGWQNPPMPWQELERRLSGRAEPDDRDELVGDGGDSPAWSRKRTAYIPATDARPIDGGAPRVRYAELHAHSSFSFLDGASSPEEMVEEAVRLGLSALTLTDHDGFYGIVRFSEAAETLAPTVIGDCFRWTSRCRPQSERMVAARVGKPDPTGPTCSCWPATRPAMPAWLERSAPPSNVVASRAARCTTVMSWRS
jgi:error-prone DNA polymerase